MTAPFVHLRVHTEYSISDGLIKVPELAERAASFDMPAVAITDRSNLFGLIKFYDACRDAGVKPIIGADLTYVSPRVDGTAEPPSRHRCLVLALDDVGYRNIIALVSKAYLDIAERGCVARSWLVEHSDGVIMLSGA